VPDDLRCFDCHKIDYTSTSENPSGNRYSSGKVKNAPVNSYEINPHSLPNPINSASRPKGHAKLSDNKAGVPMVAFPYFREFAARKAEANSSGPAFAPEGGSNPVVGKYCAYNQTRQRVLCVNVEAVDFSTTGLDALLPGLTPSSEAGLWIVPIQNISPTSIRVPLDLIYLDNNYGVLDAVESFPLFLTTASTGSATSVLVLPAQTIGSTGTQPGDQLILCAPEEMKQRLQQLETSCEQSQASSKNAVSVNDRLNQNAVGNVLSWVDRSDPKLALARSVIAPTITASAATSTPLQPDQAPATRWKATPSKSWLQRLLLSEPADPRKTERVALPWLVAYFFTGARPVAHDIRDISVTGMFVFTEDRWYPGTVVRITLTDKRNPIAMRSLTINAEVMRLADDGVGFQFVLKDGKDSRHASASGVDRQAQGVFHAEVEQFLQRLGSGAN
jgi:hypothetical protein